MFFPPPPPSDFASPASLPARSPSTNRGFRTKMVIVAGLCVVTSIGLVNASRRAAGEIYLPGNTKYTVVKLSRYPIPGSIYESTEGITFAAAIGLNIGISTTVASVGPGVPLPGPGEMIDGEAVFDVGVEVVTSTEHDNIADYGRAATVRVTDLPPVVEAAGVGPPVPNGTWNTELLSLEIMGQLTGPSGPVPMILRESPTLASLGQHVLTPLPDGGLNINSFFDVFFELSLDGGPFVPADGPMRLDITDIVPEPASLVLIGIASVMASVRRRRRR